MQIQNTYTSVQNISKEYISEVNTLSYRVMCSLKFFYPSLVISNNLCVYPANPELWMGKPWSSQGKRKSVCMSCLLGFQHFSNMQTHLQDTKAPICRSQWHMPNLKPNKPSLSQKSSSCLSGAIYVPVGKYPCIPCHL